MCPLSLRVFLLKHLQSQGHLLCSYLLFSREQTRYFQQDGGSELFLAPVSTTEEVFLIDLWIQDVFMCSLQVPGQTVEAVSLAFLVGSLLLFCMIHCWDKIWNMEPHPLPQPLGVFSSSVWSTVGPHKLCTTSSAFIAVGSFLLFHLFHRWVVQKLPLQVQCQGLVAPYNTYHH